IKAGEQIKERGFSRSAGSEQSQKFAGSHIERNAIYRTDYRAAHLVVAAKILRLGGKILRNFGTCIHSDARKPTTQQFSVRFCLRIRGIRSKSWLANLILYCTGVERRSCLNQTV